MLPNNFRDFILNPDNINDRELNEMKLTRRADYVNITRKYVDAVNAIFNSRKYEQMSTFTVNGKDYYCVLVMKGMFLEPHFGLFVEGKFQELQDAIKSNDSLKIKSLLKSDIFVRKDGYTDDNSNLTKIISYVFSITADFVGKKPITDLKIMGNPRKFSIYKALINQNMKDIPYKIIGEFDDEYSDKEGNKLPAKALHLKYNFA